VEKLVGSIYLEDQEGHGRIAVRWILGKWAVRMECGWNWEMGCEDGMWMELAQNHFQWWAVVLAVLNLRVFLLKC
jgi:hypothetical protein